MRRRGLTATFVLAFALALPGSAAMVSARDDPETAEREARDELARRLRDLYPEITQVAFDARALTQRLLDEAAGEVVTIEGRELNIKLVAAEMLEAVGEGKAARALWTHVARSATENRWKAEAMFELGQHYLFRERYSDAWKYWKHLATLAPESRLHKLSTRYEVFLRYADALRIRERAIKEALDKKDDAAASAAADAYLYPKLPEFSGSFSALGEVSRSDFEGDWLLLEFWSSRSPEAGKNALALEAAIADARAAGFRGIVLGVNLDASREDFEKALSGWTRAARRGEDPTKRYPIRTWPQHHDGRRFESLTVRALGVPREPMQILVNPRGEITYLTRSGASLTAALARVAREASDGDAK